MTQTAATTPLFTLMLIDAPSEGIDALRDTLHMTFASKARALEKVLRYLGNKLPSQGDLSNDPEILQLAFGDIFTERQQDAIVEAYGRDDEALTKALLALPIETQEDAADKAFEYLDGDGQQAQYQIAPVIVEA